ncbi:MAG: MOSC domain-containing protein [Nitrososphaerales archaeon]
MIESPAMIQYLSEPALLAALPQIEDSPKDRGQLEMIVIRPRDQERVVLDESDVSLRLGVHGDMWAKGCSKTLEDGSPHPDVQITLMNSRCIALLAQDKSRWPLAGDQLYVDLDLSVENLPVGQRLAIGTAILEITAVPHTGCAAFAERFGRDALKFVNSPTGRRLHLRGIYARVVQDGHIKTGDLVTKI